MAEESSSATEYLRENFRENSRIIRRNKRDNLLDKRRGVEDVIEEVSAEKVRELSHILRKRGATDVHLLAKLQRGLLQGPDRVSTFLSTDGALNGLVKALSGLDPVLELKAAYCICNLSLSGGRAAAKISKTAAPYLIVHIEGMNPLMQDACAWALGNLAAGGRHSWSLLYAQGALPKLVNLLTSPHSDVVTAAIYSLSHFLRTGSSNLQVTELQGIVRNAAPLLTKHDIAVLLFLLSTSPTCDEEFCDAKVPENCVLKLSELLVNCDLTIKSNLTEITFLIRTIANLSAESSQAALAVINAFMGSQNFVLTTLLSSQLPPHICKETVWLLTNLFKHGDQDVVNFAQNLIPLLNMQN